MGASSSSDADSSVDGGTTEEDDVPGAARYVGYRVLGVQPNSPASQAGLVSFFDFIVASGSTTFSTLDGAFVELIKTAAASHASIPLTVYNIKSRSFRSISLSPSSNWPGAFVT